MLEMQDTLWTEAPRLANTLRQSTSTLREYVCPHTMQVLKMKKKQVDGRVVWSWQLIVFILWNLQNSIVCLLSREIKEELQSSSAVLLKLVQLINKIQANKQNTGQCFWLLNTYCLKPVISVTILSNSSTYRKKYNLFWQVQILK